MYGSDAGQPVPSLYTKGLQPLCDNFAVYSQGTDYEVQVDVGQCSSGRTCGSNEAVSLDIKTIASPDGQLTHT